MKTLLRTEFLASALCLLAAAVACVQDDARMPGPSDSALPSPSPTHRAVPQTMATPALLAPTPTPQMGHGSMNLAWRVSPSLEEQMLKSEAIVRATFESASAGTETVPSDPGVAPTHRAVHLLRFTAHEYLKGSGPSQVVVVVREDHTYVVKADALETGAKKVAATQYHLGRPGGGPLPGAIWWLVSPRRGIHRLAGECRVPAQVRVPTVQSRRTDRVGILDRHPLAAHGCRPEKAGRAGASGSTVRTFITDGSKSPPPTVSFADLRSRIAELEATLAAGAGIEGFLRCIRGKYGHERHRRARPWTPRDLQAALVSGQTEGTEVDRDDYTGVPKYHRYRLTGPDADLFRTLVSDADADPANGFDNVTVTARPLPGGVYRFQHHWQFYSDIPCNFIPDDVYDEWTITVTAPAGTLHEALFDPVAVGADSSNGVIEPNAFSLDGTTTTISSLKWEGGAITMTLSPSASLAGYAVDLIALDGSVTTTLAFDDATQSVGTLAWNVPDKPWSDGDLLMLRIHKPTPR